MSWSKRLLKHSRTQTVLAALLAGYIRFVFRFSRIERYVHPAAETYMRGEDNAIFAFWHGRMMLLPCFEPPGRKMHVLISFHRDGKLISDVIGRFGEGTISGSSSKGGKEAVRAMLRLLKNGDNISITPDGPRGPFQTVAAGTPVVARLSGKPVLPVAFSAVNHKRLKSWDKFMLARPFGRIVFCVGEPIVLSQYNEDEEARLAIEEAMTAVTRTADEKAHVTL